MIPGIATVRLLLRNFFAKNITAYFISYPIDHINHTILTGTYVGIIVGFLSNPSGPRVPNLSENHGEPRSKQNPKPLGFWGEGEKPNVEALGKGCELLQAIVGGPCFTFWGELSLMRRKATRVRFLPGRAESPPSIPRKNEALKRLFFPDFHLPHIW